MPGFNHYPDCTCGWCVNYGRNRVDRGQIQWVDRELVQSEVRRRDALLLLERYSVSSITGCYVNSNARCPVCGKPVFFYFNKFGSKVYFDDLGPPWPKHPCTDNPKTVGQVQFMGSLSRREKGLSHELASAARTVGMHPGGASWTGANDWNLMVVVFSSKSGEINTVVAEYLSERVGRTCKFTYISENPLINVGDYVSNRGNQFSFIDPEALVPITFKYGSRIKANPNISEVKKPKTANSDLAALEPIIVRSRKEYDRSYDDMTNSEVIHFHSTHINVADLCARLEPVVKRYARAGTRKPQHVADRLNAEGYRTANGSRWTARLTRFLLALIFNKSAQQKTTQTPAVERPLNHASKNGHREDRRHGASESIAERLSKLGRVTLKKK